MIPRLGSFSFIGLGAESPDASKVISEFKSCLGTYKELAESLWTGWALDADQTFKIGDELSISKDKDYTSPVTNYATCPLNGEFTLVHAFEAARFVPIGNTPVRLEPVTRAWNGDEVTGPVINDEIGPSGIKVISGCKRGQLYRITFFPNVTKAQVEALYSSYQGVIQKLAAWLQSEWTNQFQPLWSTYQSANSGQRLKLQLEAALEGFEHALLSLWDDIKSLFQLIAHPYENAKKLAKYLSPDELKKLYTASKESLSTALLIASDEPLMFIYVAAIVSWVKLLPPQTCVEVLAQFTGELLINIVVGIILSGGAGLAIRVGTKALETLKSGQATALISKLADTLINASQSHALSVHADTLKPLAAHGEISEANTARKINAKVAPASKRPTPADTPSQTIENASTTSRNKTRRQTRLSGEEKVDDVSKPAKDPNDKPSQECAKTCTNGCPVSMVTGEELLTLTDGELDGVLAFPWSRLYRTSAVEHNVGLGYGWSHSLAHRLEIQGDTVIWTDHENRRTEFPLPSQQRPAITNRLSAAAIYLGEDPSELVLAQAGATPRFYHFRRIGQSARLIAISDAYSNTLSISRDARDRIVRLRNNTSRALRFTYEHAHIVAVDYQVYRPADNEEASWHTVQTLTTYRYNAQGQLLSATNAAGESEHYRYNDQHVIQERQLAGGATFFWEWEGEGKQSRCVHHWANFSQMDTRYVWEDNGTVTVHNSDGSQQVYQHDENARLVQQIDPDGAKHQKIYDEKGQLIAEKDPLGAITEYQHDEAGHLIAVIPPEDEPTYYEYHKGFVRTVSRGKAVWKYRRNAQGDITAQTDPDGNTTHYHYDSRGNLLSIQHPDGSRHELTWNPQGQLIEELLPDGGKRRYQYDALGRQITRQDESGAVTQYQWDAVGRLSQVTLPGGGTRAFTYNAYGKITAERDELGRITRYEYADNLHLVSRRINPDGSQLRYRYDNARLLLTEIENERGEHYQLDYYPNGLIREETGFDGRTTAYAYDLNGHLTEKTEFGEDGSQLVTCYQRDTAGRLLVKTLPDDQKIHYAYDALGRLVSVDDGQWPLAYEYDLQDRLITEHQGWATFRYQYDALGQLSHCRLPDGSLLDYRYRHGGLLSAIDLNGQPLTAHQYLPGGREQYRQQGALLSHYHYDEQGRLQAHRISQQERSVYQRRYAYDAKGNLAAIEDSRKGNKHFHYDPLDRLIAVRGDLPESFAHDPAGNLLSQTGQEGARLANVKGNRLLMQGDSHYDYDAYGNLTRERRGAAQRLVTEYRYDSQHRLIAATLPDGRIAEYRYDAFGRRIAKTVDGQTTEFLWQGERLIAENGQDHYRSYIYEPGTFRPLAMLHGEGQAAEPYYYQLDHLGTPQELTSTAGSIVWSAKYRAYGNVAKLEVAELENPLRFQGQYFDQETGLHYNRHRYYNPNTGRFLTPDPIKLAGGLNNYQYVPNPTGWVDPLGLNNCPGIASCSTGTAETPTANINSGEPNAPSPERSREERQSKIERLSEANAKRRVKEYEERYDMHTITKHGPEIPRDKLKQRAIDGTDPSNGELPKKAKGNPSSQFKNWKLQLHAINAALTREARGLPLHTGVDHKGNNIVRVDLPGAGRGYKPNKKDPQNPKFNENMNGAEVKFDKDNTRRPFTAFPVDNL